MFGERISTGTGEPNMAMTLFHKRDSLGSRLQAISERRLPSRSVRPVLLSGLVLILMGCSTIPVAAPPQIVTVTHTIYQPIPTAYLTPCLIPVGTPATNGELLIHDQAAMSDLMACNQQLQRIKTLAPPATTHP